MRRLADDLKEIIERMNAASRQTEASADPVTRYQTALDSRILLNTCFKDCQDCANFERPHGLVAVGRVELHGPAAQVGRRGSRTRPTAAGSRSELPFRLISISKLVFMASLFSVQ